jgi:unsaturated chondroitin disaccharide hydrolase
MLYLTSNKEIEPVYKNHILLEADKALDSKLVSITHNEWKQKFNVSPNEYVSLSTYYWPDPNNPNCKYIKKPEINNDKYKYSDRKYIDIILNKIQYLALAYKISNNQAYADKGIKFIKCFFLNSKTHMIPRLSHSGIIIKDQSKNSFTTHGCIIDTNSFCILGDLVEIIFNGSESDTTRSKNAMMLWFKNMSDWFLYSDYGIKAQARTNNWLTSYYVQVLSYLYASGQTESCKNILENNFERILTTQIEHDGTQPYEQTRDNPIHYSNYNLHLLTRLALIGKKYNIDIWSYKNSSGKGSLYTAMINTANLIKKHNKISEIGPDYVLTWAKIAYSIYEESIFKDVYSMHENKLEYCLDEFL